MVTPGFYCGLQKTSKASATFPNKVHRQSQTWHPIPDWNWSYNKYGQYTEKNYMAFWSFNISENFPKTFSKISLLVFLTEVKTTVSIFLDQGVWCLSAWKWFLPQKMNAKIWICYICLKLIDNNFGMIIARYSIRHFINCLILLQNCSFLRLMHGCNKLMPLHHI